MEQPGSGRTETSALAEALDDRRSAVRQTGALILGVAAASLWQHSPFGTFGAFIEATIVLGVAALVGELFLVWAGARRCSGSSTP